MTITLSDELDEFVRRSVSEGNYDSPEGMVESALRLLQERNRRQELANQISAYAEKNAGSDHDLDEALEAAGIECVAGES